METCLRIKSNIIIQTGLIKITWIRNILKIYVLKIEMHIRLYGSCGTDLWRSIAEVTDNIHAIGVVKPVYERSTFPLTTTAV